MARYFENDATISDCGRYRYLLRRTWDTKTPRALFVMLNPSTADARVDDPTIRSCVRLSSALQFGSLEVVNLFAWRATEPDELMTAAEPVGEKNDVAIMSALGRCDLAVCAWGAHTAAVKRARQVIEMMRSHRPAIFCFDKTKSGAPKHPLYIKTGTPLLAYP